ncbi:hypothetical protein B566_EDAN000716 [Ephemera danica]|nr:hypothetical protein B566_EDAN000716 [Ephemera danica]
MLKIAEVGKAVENETSSEEEEEDQGLTLLGSMKVGKDGESLNKKVKKKKKKKRSQEETQALQHEEGVNRLRNEHKLKVWSNADDSKGKVAEPIQSFEELAERYGMGEDLLANISKAGYKVPTPVQMQAIPAMIEGCQLLACAPTGSGKTAAFLLPVIHQLGVPKGGGVRAVLVSPTRELAQQTHRECLKLAEGRRLRIHLLSKVKAAAKRIGPKGSHKIDILITTPNRLIYLLNQEPVGICLKNVEWLVVDESDKLFEEGKQGFRDQLAHIYQVCDGSKVRRAMFSATHTAPVAGWCRKNLTDLVCVNVGVRNTAVETVKQTLQFVGNEDGKLLQFRNMVGEGMPTPVLLFVQTKDRAQQLFQELIYDGINVDVIHAGRTQQQRDNTVRCFREGKIWVLICTELMARGIDFKGVSLVINYDFPPSIISYIHRIGRTGRAGKPGQAVTFFTMADMKYLRSIAQVLVDSGCEVPEYILKLDKTNKTDRKELAAKAPKRKSISTEPVFDRVKREKISD